MIFHLNHLPSRSDDSHEMSSLIISEKKKHTHTHKNIKPWSAGDVTGA